MARIDSILSLDRRDIESFWLAMYGRLNFPTARPPVPTTYLGILGGATAGEYLAIQEAVASLGGELVIPPAHIQRGLLEATELGVIGGLIVADPTLAPPQAPCLCLNSTAGKPLDVITQLYPRFIQQGFIDGTRVACDDSTALTWFEATGDLPISVIHSGMTAIDPGYQAELAAEGQAGTYRHVLRTDMRSDIDARKPPAHAHLAAAIAVGLDVIGQ